MNSKHSFISSKKLNVFIADDDPDDIDLFKMVVKDFSREIKISIASNGLELLDFLEVVIPDIIFLDINMPCMNGIDCLREIRKQEKLISVPVVMYSTTAEKKHIDLSYDLGANLYLQKPSSLASIKDHLQQTFSFTLSDLIPQPPKEKYVLKIASEKRF